MEKFSKLIQSNLFRKIVVISGAILAIGSIFISVNPETFLKTGYWGVFLYGIFGPVTVIIPAMSQHYNLYILSAVAAAGVVVNDTLAYIVGRNADVFIIKNKKVLVAENWVSRYGYFALFAISVLPIPYDFIGLIVGYLDLSFKKYAIPLFVGKVFRFVLIGLGTNLVLFKF